MSEGFGSERVVRTYGRIELRKVALFSKFSSCDTGLLSGFRIFKWDGDFTYYMCKSCRKSCYTCIMCVSGT